MDFQNRCDRFVDRYATGDIPWDAVLPPPELMAFVEAAAPGRALDLGCGYGRSSIYLAQHGWRVDGVDFVPQAIAEAKKRANVAGLSDLICFHTASVAQLDFLQPPYDLALDIGCLHALEDVNLISYRDGLVRLLPVGAIYLLFAHLRDETAEPEEDAPRWITDDLIRQLFTDYFTLEKAVYGETQVADKPPWASAWYTFLRY